MNPLFATTLGDFASAIAWSPGGDAIACATLAGEVVAIEATTGAIRWRGEGHRGGALAIAWDPKGEIVASGGEDGRARLHDAKSGATRNEIAFEGRDAWVSSCAFDPEGSSIAIAVGRSVVFLGRDGAIVGEVADHASTVTAIAHHPAIGWMSACYGGVHVLDPAAKRPAKRFPLKGSILAIAPSADGRWIATGNQDATVRVWDRTAGHDVSLTGYLGKVRLLAWSGGILATGGGDDVVAWPFYGEGPRGVKPMRIAHGARVTGVDFLDEGRTMIGATRAGELQLRSTNEVARVAARATPFGGAPIEGIVAHAASRRVAIVGPAGKIAVVAIA